MCRVLQVSRGGYYSWLNRSPGKREKENNVLLKRIRYHYETSFRTYGSPRITDCLHDEGYMVSRPRIARLMRKNDIYAETQREFKVTTDSYHKYSISPNLLQQDFSAEHPEQIWVSDITYISTMEGWLYLTVITDLFNRAVVGWAMSNSLKTSNTTIPALKQAYSRYCPLPGLIFHSDRGVQYACVDFRKYLSKYNMIQSMSSKGNCYDNAVAESFFSTLKKELIYRNRYKTRWEARQSIFNYIEIFYNRKRKHSSLMNLSPVQLIELRHDV